MCLDLVQHCSNRACQKSIDLAESFYELSQQKNSRIHFPIEDSKPRSKVYMINVWEYHFFFKCKESLTNEMWCFTSLSLVIIFSERELRRKGNWRVKGKYKLSSVTLVISVFDFESYDIFTFYSKESSLQGTSLSALGFSEFNRHAQILYCNPDLSNYLVQEIGDENHRKKVTK